MGKDNKPIGFDEIFKILMKHYFENFSKVTTDYEIIGLPKKTDLLIIETTKPILDHVKVFSYFKEVNIIEFKSINDTFRINEDLYKIGIYIGGVLLKANEANIDNSTFTLVSSRKPVKLLKMYEKSVQNIKNGVYLIKRIALLPVYVVVIEEIELDFDKEVKILKEFSTKKDLELFLIEVAHKAEEGLAEYIELFRFAYSMYLEAMDRIIKQEGINMTEVEKNVEKLSERFGLKDKFKNEGKIETAIKMLEKGMDIDFVMDITGFSKQEVERLQDNIKKQENKKK